MRSRHIKNCQRKFWVTCEYKKLRQGRKLTEFYSFKARKQFCVPQCYSNKSLKKAVVKRSFNLSNGGLFGIILFITVTDQIVTHRWIIDTDRPT